MGHFRKNSFLYRHFWLLFMILVTGSCCLVGLYVISSYPTLASQAIEVQPPAFKLPEVSLGNVDAPHTVIMYFALDCTHCRHYEEKVLPEIKTQFIDTGQVHFIMRDFPLGAAGILASKLCWAKRDSTYYQEMVKKIFAKQKAWDFESVKDVKEYKEKLEQFAMEEGNLTQAEFEDCMEDKELENAIIGERLQAQAAGVEEVPTFVIDGQRIDQVLTPDVLKDFLSKQSSG